MLPSVAFSWISDTLHGILLTPPHHGIHYPDPRISTITAPFWIYHDSATRSRTLYTGWIGYLFLHSSYYTYLLPRCARAAFCADGAMLPSAIPTCSYTGSGSLGPQRARHRAQPHHLARLLTFTWSWISSRTCLFAITFLPPRSDLATSYTFSYHGFRLLDRTYTDPAPATVQSLGPRSLRSVVTLSPLPFLGLHACGCVARARALRARARLHRAFCSTRMVLHTATAYSAHACCPPARATAGSRFYTTRDTTAVPAYLAFTLLCPHLRRIYCVYARPHTTARCRTGYRMDTVIPSPYTTHMYKAYRLQLTTHTAFAVRCWVACARCRRCTAQRTYAGTARCTRWIPSRIERLSLGSLLLYHLYGSIVYRGLRALCHGALRFTG